MSLKEMRKKRGLLIKELSALTGISQGVLLNLDCGAHNINAAKLDTLVKLALALDCKFEDLVTDEELKTKLKLIYKKGSQSQ